MAVRVVCPITAPSGVSGGEVSGDGASGDQIPDGLVGRVACDPGPVPVWHLDVPTSGEDPEDVALVRQFLHWRSRFESVFLIGEDASVEQLCRIARGLLEAEDVTSPGLSIVSAGGMVQGTQLQTLENHLGQSAFLLGEIATPGWALTGPDGEVGRRDLSLGGVRVLAESDDWAVAVDPRRGYVLAHQSETGLDDGARILSIDQPHNTVETENGSHQIGDPTEGLEGELSEGPVYSLIHDLLPGKTGQWVPTETPPREVFATQLANLQSAVDYAQSQPFRGMYFYRGPADDPTYLAV